MAFKKTKNPERNLRVFFLSGFVFSRLGSDPPVNFALDGQADKIHFCFAGLQECGDALECPDWETRQHVFVPQFRSAHSYRSRIGLI